MNRPDDFSSGEEDPWGEHTARHLCNHHMSRSVVAIRVLHCLLQDCTPAEGVDCCYCCSRVVVAAAADHSMAAMNTWLGRVQEESFLMPIRCHGREKHLGGVFF